MLEPYRGLVPPYRNVGRGIQLNCWDLPNTH
nr:MAG TPA: hypothetical protein [Caudoviricetes sp.]